MYPLSAYLFKLARWLQRLSRAFTQLARRDALNLTASAPRLSDLLSKSRSGDAADQQVACVCTPCSAAWSAVAIIFVSRLADAPSLTGIVGAFRYSNSIHPHFQHHDRP